LAGIEVEGLEDVEKGMGQAGMSAALVDVFMEMYRGAAKGLVAPEEGGDVVHGQTTFDTFAQQALRSAT
jgi:hypothetical protein